MLLLILMFNCGALFGTIDFALAGKCKKIDASLLPACANIGYNFTANFSNVGQLSYQAYVSSELELFADRFNSCSPHAKALVCARYVPKCSEGVEGPVLPCREFCEQFVDDCETALRAGGLYNRYVAYCGLLSSRDNLTKCLEPQGFVPQANRTKEISLPSCEAVTKPACLNNNLSNLGNETRARLQYSLNSLAPVLHSNCSFNLKRLACFIETGPCVTDDGYTLDTCQSLCQEVKNSCEDKFQRHSIFFPRCIIPNFSEVGAGGGLCRLSQWPVPWPNSVFNRGRKTLQCYCSECKNNTCRTDGSCLVQRGGDGTSVFVQSCLDRGPNRDLVCNSALPSKQNVHCCEKDYCNGQNMTDKPTKISTEKRDKGRVKKKNAPEITPTPDGSDNKSRKPKKLTLSSGILATAVVGFLLIVFLVTFLLHRTVKKFKENARLRRRNTGKYVNKSNISTSGKSVTIGDSNKGFENSNVYHNESVLY